MGKIIPILLLFVSGLCYGQGKYRTCTAKTFDSWNNLIATKTQSFNKFGKIILDSTHSNDRWLSEITWYTYINDTFLAEELTASGTGDSNRVWYYYDANNRLIETRTNSYERQVQSCIRTDDEIKEWGDTLITRYTYNQDEQVAEEIIRYKRNINVDAVIGGLGSGWYTNRIIYTYDNLHRLLSQERQHIYRLNDRAVELYGDSEIRKPGEAGSVGNRKRGYPDTFATTKTTYYYSKDKLIKENEDVEFKNKDSVIIEYTFDNKKRIITEYEHQKAWLPQESKIRYYKYNPDKYLYKEMVVTPDLNTGKNEYQTTFYTYE